MSEVLTAAVPFTGMPVSERAAWLLEHLNLQEATGDPEAGWEIHQLEFLDGPDTLTHDTSNLV